MKRPAVDTRLAMAESSVVGRLNEFEVAAVWWKNSLQDCKMWMNEVEVRNSKKGNDRELRPGVNAALHR